MSYALHDVTLTFSAKKDSLIFRYDIPHQFQYKLYVFYRKRCKDGCDEEYGGLLVGKLMKSSSSNRYIIKYITLTNFIELKNVAAIKYSEEERTYTYEYDKSLRLVWEEKLKLQGLCIIGEWHTHPNYTLEVPSLPSDEDLEDSLKNPLELRIVVGETYLERTYPFYQMHAYQNGQVKKISEFGKISWY